MNEELREDIKRLKSLAEDWEENTGTEKNLEALNRVIDTATQVLNAQTVMPKEIPIEFKNFKIDTAEKAVASQVGFNDCLKEATLTHSKLMLAKEEEISKLQGEVNKLEEELDVSERALRIADAEPLDRSQEAQHYNWLDEQNDKLKQENEKLRSEIAEARKALELIASFPEGSHRRISPNYPKGQSEVDIAKKALGNK